MKTFIFSIALFMVLSLFACKSDNSADTEDISDETVEAMVDDIIEEQMAEIELAENADEQTKASTVANEVEFELEEVKIDVEKKKAQKKEILSEQYKDSPNRGKDCDRIMKDYEALVNKYLKQEDVEGVLKELGTWANDPIYNRCKKDPAYKDKFYELEEKMYAEDDEEL